MSEEWKIQSFWITLPPRGQARARATALVEKTTGQPRRDSATGRVIIVHFKDAAQEADEKKLEALMFEHRPARPLKGQLLLGVRAYFAVPKSRPKKFQAAALAGEIRPTGKPDLDNILKHVKDVGTGIFWEDDKQVVGYIGATGKYYHEVPHYEISIGYLPALQTADYETAAHV